MVGKTLGHYEIIELLGAGGMGEVYLGEDTRLGRKVAIKVLPEEYASDPERLARFEREAKMRSAHHFFGGPMPWICALLVLTVVAACARTDSPDVSGSGQVDAELSLFDASELGTVDLPVSCSDGGAERMEHGLALLHHMAYTEADLVFQSVLDEDPSCGMGYWGSAMTLIHPWWPDVPTEAQLDQGLALVEQALALGPKTEWEQAYIDAVAAYFRGAHERTDPERLVSFHEGWQNVHERFPEDWEATAFYALTGAASRVGSLPRTTAGGLMEELLAMVPDHPAGQHYLIHSYDTPMLAADALEVAHMYGELAPGVPHALHMPTHIYTRLGLWSESIDLNERSVAAAWEQGPLVKGLDIHYGHALGFLIYAYLQKGQDAEARAVRDRVLSVEGPISQLNRQVFAAHLAGIPVRYALERHEWEEAAQLETRLAAGFPWDEGFGQYDALTYFGRAIGHARSGDARAAREALGQLKTSLAGSTAALLIAYGPILSMAAEGWVEYAEGEVDRAVTTMAEAAERSISTTWLGLSELLPAGELLADLYLELGRHAEALTTYEAVLKRQPNRFNSLCGAARAAELVGEPGRARSHYQMLIQVADPSSSRECLRNGRAFVTAG